MFSALLSFVFSNLLYFALHLDSSSTFPKPLSAKQERECFAKLAQGDQQARNKLIEHNLRLVAHIIKKYYSKTGEQEDLISIGTIGLIKAVSTFHYDKGTRFATYGARCIENEILMHFRNQKKSANNISLSEPIDTDKNGNALTLMDMIPDECSITETVDLKLKSHRMYELLAQLDDRERKILCMRYGLCATKPLTQNEVAKKLGISRSYVSRIEKKAIATLRKQFDAP